MEYKIIPEIEAQKKYNNLIEWHDAGIKGQGINVWNTESASDHGKTTTRRIYDAAPRCNVLQASLSMYTKDDAVVATCNYKGVEYDVEEFIKKYDIHIVTRSVGGGTAIGRPESKYWNNLKTRYNLVIFNSSGNDGSNGCGGAIPPDVALYIAACTLTKGKPRRANYSSIGIENDFINFTGVWNGTSFAAPYTAGMAALLKQRFGKDITQEEVFEYLKVISKDLQEDGFDNYTGWGIPILPSMSDKTTPRRKEDNEVTKSIVCIDAGHCKLTTGKRAFDGSFLEYEFNLDVANRIKKHLDRHKVESYVQYVENSDPEVELNARISAINKEKPILVVSIHANAFGTDWDNANGWEIFCNTPSNINAKGTLLAKAIQRNSKVLGLKDRGIKDAHGVAGIVIKTTPPAVLIEHGFYTNQKELEKLKTDNFREQCAEADAKGILEYLGIKWKEETMPDKKTHWAEKHLDSLVEKGLINSPEVHRNTLDEPISKGQIFALMDRITDKK